MRYIKTYEAIKNVGDPALLPGGEKWYRASGEGGTDHEEFDIGDIVTCVQNIFEKNLKIGKKYEIIDKHPKYPGCNCNYYYVKNLETNRKLQSGFASYSFTKDVENYNLKKAAFFLKRDAELYNL